MTEAVRADQKIPFTVREMRKEEVAFVASTWMRSYVDSPWAKRIEQQEYFDGHGKLVNETIARSVTVVAEHATEAGLLLGFACGMRTEDATVWHYVYVKGYARGNRIAAGMMDALRTRIGGKREIATHRKAPATEVMARYGIKYSPYPLWVFAGKTGNWDTRRKT